MSSYPRATAKEFSARKGGVYLAVFLDPAGNRYVKIGKANAPLKRLANLTVACPHEFSGLHYVFMPDEKRAFKAERAIQARLVPRRLRGEWFYYAADEADVLRSAITLMIETCAMVAQAKVSSHYLDSHTYARLAKRYRDMFGPPERRRA